MYSRLYNKMIRLRNKKAAVPKVKSGLFIIIILFCLSMCGCQGKRDIDLIGMEKGRLEKLLAETPDSALKVDILNELAYRTSWDGGKKPLYYAKKAKQIAEKLNYKKGEVDAFCMLGQINYLKGDVDESRKFCGYALILAREIKYRTGEAMVYNGFARCHQKRGEYRSALENFLKSEEMCRKRHDEIDKRTLGQAYYGIAALYYYDPLDYQKFIKYFEKIFDIGKEIKDNNIIASVFYAIGEMNRAFWNYRKAVECFNNCLDLSKRIKSIYNEANAYEGFGDILVDLGNVNFDLFYNHPGFSSYMMALEFYRKSHKLFLLTGNKFQVAEIMRSIGMLYNRIGVYFSWREYFEIAYGYLFLALDIAKEVNIPRTIERICEEIRKSCENLGEYEEASFYYRLVLEKERFLRENEMSKQKLIIDYTMQTERDKITRISLIIVLSCLLIISVVLFINIRKRLKKEQEISRHKDDLIHTVYHQYKTPLAVIDSSTQILKEYWVKLSKNEIKRHFDIILSNIKEMTRLIDQFLKFGKEFAPQDCDLYIICRDVIEEIKPNEGAKHRIDYAASGDCVRFKVDRDYMNIILRNLVVNAIKYSGEDSRIIVELRCEKHHAVIKVIDQGIGVPDDYLRMPFERFHRGSNVKGIPGTGLGLAIVKRYVDMHVGTISIDSKLGVGTTVTVTIPRSREL